MITKDEIASGYDKVANKIGMTDDFYKRVKQIAGPLQGKVLDIGCGGGELVAILRDGTSLPAEDFEGVDISPVLVERAEKNNPNSKFQVGDSENLSIESNKFDFAFMTEAIEHMLDYNKSISEACRVLKTGGKFVITAPNRDWLRYDFYKPYIDKDEFQPVQDHYFCVNEIKDYLTNNGFKILKIEASDNLYFYGWKHNYIEQPLAKIFPFLYTKMKRLIILCEKK